jgi:transcriptional regulator with XRE-family HTH domain
MTFRENLKSELSYKNIIVKELAVMTGISKSTLDNYLNVRGYIPSAEAAVKIASALGVTVEYLITGEDIPHVRASHGPEIKELILNFKQLNEDDRKLVKDIIELLKAKGRKNGKPERLD